MSTPVSVGSRPAMSPPATLARGAGIGIGLALVANLIVFLIGSAGAPLQVIIGNDTTPSDLPIGAVIAASVVPLLIGAVGLGVLQRFLTKGMQIWTALVGVLTVASIVGPLGLDIDDGSKVALTIMHLATGAAAVIGQTLAHHSTGGSK